MRHVRKWDQGEFSEPRPLAFLGQPHEHKRPSSFPWKPGDFDGIPHGGRLQSARIFYKLGWTALLFWNRDLYFVDETLTFDGMIELIRSRFAGKFYLQGPITREYVD